MGQLSRIMLSHDDPRSVRRVADLGTADIDVLVSGVVNAIVAILQTEQPIRFTHRHGLLTLDPQQFGNGAHNVVAQLSESMRRHLFLRPQAEFSARVYY